MNEIKRIARNISMIENRVNGFEDLLLNNNSQNTVKIIGITGAPGTGKSTLTDGLIKTITDEQKRVAVICIDPSSPFNMGALLGDRIRMNKWHNNDYAFIRSMASRKALGGLSAMIIEVTEYLKTENFDYIIIETVGVGQNEIDICGLADVTVLVMVPEGGDEIQAMKSGIMEIANVFVINKSDRPGADRFANYLHAILAPAGAKEMIPVIKTIADKHDGIDILYNTIKKLLQRKQSADKHYILLAEKAYQLIQFQRMKDVHKEIIFEAIKEEIQKDTSFNLYRFIKKFQNDF